MNQPSPPDPQAKKIRMPLKQPLIIAAYLSSLVCVPSYSTKLFRSLQIYFTALSHGMAGRRISPNPIPDLRFYNEQALRIFLKAMKAQFCDQGVPVSPKPWPGFLIQNRSESVQIPADSSMAD